MIERVLIVVLAVVATTYGIDYYIDSSIECDQNSNHEVFDNVHVKGGRAMDSSYSMSSENTCKMTLHAETDPMYSPRTLKIKLEKAVIDNYQINVRVYDGSDSLTSDLKLTLGKHSPADDNFETTQPFVLIIVDKTLCLDDTACMQGFELDMKVTSSDSRLTTGALIGIIIGAIVGFCLLVGMICICCCCCCCMAASNGERRRGQNVTTATTYGSVGEDDVYQTQHIVITATTVSPHQATSDNRTGTTQDCNSAMAPPPYPGNQPVHNPYLQKTYPQQQHGQLNPAM